MLGFKKIEIHVPALQVIKTKNQIPLQTHYTQMETTERPVTHFLFVKPNESKQEDLPAKRTAFVLNIPMDATEEHFRQLFKEHGTIERIKWPISRHPGCSCHIVFEDEESLDSIMEMDEGEWVPSVLGLESKLNSQ
jgi:RNA recognition motif-containing protein